MYGEYMVNTQQMHGEYMANTQENNMKLYPELVLIIHNYTELLI